MKSRLICLVGSMKSGKSEELIRQCKRYMFAKKKVLLVKPKLDKRFSENEIVSRNGERLQCISISSIYDILEYITSEIDVVAIDELHLFAPNEVEEVAVKNVLQAILDKKKIVICAGLDMDYLGRPFNVVPYVMAIADEVHKFHAICSDCGEEAWVSHRLVDDEKIIIVGDEEYTPLCRECHQKRLKNVK